jgi:hypothetical protein
MLDEIIKAAYLRFGAGPFTATDFYAGVRAVAPSTHSRACRYWRNRASYHGYVLFKLRDDGARLYRLTPHGIARIENAA